jgi:D-alanine-D-alanine ligase
MGGQVDLQFPLIVKLRCEGSSKGLTERSLVNTPEELHRQVQSLRDTYGGESTIFIEEFIEGEEFTIGLIGNGTQIDICPTTQIALDGRTDLGRKFYTFSYLRQGADYICPAKIAPALAKQMQGMALRTYQAVECRDFGRVDFRVDRQGRPYVLEINPLPSLSVQDVFMDVAKTRGITYNQIVNQILDAALVRNGLKPGAEAELPSATRSH